MAARAYWQGQIRLALVSIPVEIYTATKSGAQIAFHQVHEPSGKRVKYEKVVPGIGAIDTDDIVKGYELDKGDYVLLDQDEIDAVKLESKKTLELTQFVDMRARSTCFITSGPISSSPPTIWPRKRSSCCARRFAGRRRSGWASSRCAGANMSSA